METIRQPWSTVDIEIPADCICSVGFQCLKRINGISFGLTHLLTVFILHMAKNDNILIWCLIKQQCGFCQKRIKPSTGLVYSLGNEISRKLLLK